MHKAMVVLIVGLVGVPGSGEASAWAQVRSLRATQRSAVTFRPATTTPTRGFELITVGRDRTLYVAPRGALSRTDVVSAQAIAVRNGSDVELSLKKEAATRLAGLMRKQGIDHLALFSGGKFQAAGKLEFDAADHRAVLSGLSTAQARRVTRLFGAEAVLPRGPVVSLVPSQAVVEPGGTVTVDVLLRGGIADLRAYQISLGVEANDSGRLTVENVRIDDTRTDFVFRSRQKLDALDQGGGRLGSVLFSGSLDVAAGPVHLGEFTLRASGDAAGTFRLRVRTEEAASMLLNSKSQLMRFSAAPAVEVAVAPRPGIGTPTDH